MQMVKNVFAPNGAISAVLSQSFFLTLEAMNPIAWNTIFFFLSCFVMFGGTLLIRFLFGKYGLYAWVGVCLILANIEVLKTVNLFGIDGVTLGSPAFGAVFFTTSILQEEYGEKSGWIGLAIGFSVDLLFVGAMQLDLLYVASANDSSQSALLSVFTLSPRINTVSILCALGASVSDVFLFGRLRAKWKGKWLWARAIIADIIPNIIENFIFAYGAFAFSGLFTLEEIFVIALGGSAIELICSIFDIPLLYLSRRIEPLPERNKNEEVPA